MCMVGLMGFCDLPPHGWLISQSMQRVAGFVGVERFELSTSRTRTVRSTGLSHTPKYPHQGKRANYTIPSLQLVCKSYGFNNTSWL